MTHSLFFSSSACALMVLLFLFPFLSSMGFLLALFFMLGLPHGALDIVLGKEILSGRFGRNWWIPFVTLYLLLSLAMIGLWTLWPFLSFVLFLIMSVIHFGLSDAVEKGPFRLLEGLTRGLIPLTLPAFFYPIHFQAIIESTLSVEEARTIVEGLHTLFFAQALLLGIIMIKFLYDKRLDLASELFSLILLFAALAPLTAFSIYFCFLHAIRHALSVIKESKFSLFSIVHLAFWPSVISSGCLVFFYYVLRQKQADFETMYYLFFIGIAALTFPHMIFVESLYALKKDSNSFKLN